MDIGHWPCASRHRSIDRRPRRPKDRRMKQLIISSVAALSLAAIAQPPTQMPSALESLANTERAFAKSATGKAIRDSFLEYFDEDAIAFTPTPVSATARLRSRPAHPFTEY